MRRIGRASLILILALILVLSTASLAAAQEGDPEACSGESVAGTVVSVDETTGVVTVQLEDDSLCTVQLDSDYEHPVASLLGTYFNDVNAQSLQDALESLSTSIVCPEGEDCSFAGEGEGGTDATIAEVVDLGNGTYEVTVEYTDENGDPQTETLIVDDLEQAQAWMDALESTSADWMLKTDGDGVFVSDAGDEIVALHEDGMGFGVIVKLYSMAADAAEACTTTAPDPDPEATSLCDVSVGSLVELFRSGTGLGKLFQEYGKPALLGVGHVRQALNGKEKQNEPPPNACGYWRKQDNLSPDHPCYVDAENAGDEGNSPPPNACGYWRKQDNLSPDHPCYEEGGTTQQNNGGGKPPWAGGPGGPKNQDD